MTRQTSLVIADKARILSNTSTRGLLGNSCFSFCWRTTFLLDKVINLLKGQSMPRIQGVHQKAAGEQT